MYNQNTTLTKQEKFMFPSIDMSMDGFTAEELAEDMDGLQVSFPRVKIPAGGSLQFEIPTDNPEDPDYAKTLEGIILHNHAAGAYWPEGCEYDENTAPLCSTNDGKIGIGDPGGACAACALNIFGTGPDGRGKACKNMRMLYILRSGEYMPLQLSLPPTSLNPFRQFMGQAFIPRRRATYGSVVQIGLKKMNNGSNDYSVATFRLLYDLEGEELAASRLYAHNFKEQLQMILGQQTAAIESQRDTGCDYISPDTLPADKNTSAYIGSPKVIDGMRDQLPA